MATERFPSYSEQTGASSLHEAAALAHDLSTDSYTDELWQEAAKANEEAYTVLTMANLLANGDPAIRKAIMQGYLAQTALKRRHVAIEELQRLYNSDSIPEQRTKPAA